MLEDLKREAYEANIALPRHGLITLAFGNASALDRARGIFAIKPSGVDYSVLKPDDMVLIDLEGNQVEGKFRPSSDTPTHRRLYLGFPSIGGVVHTHSSRATAFAQAGRAIPIFGTTHADYFFGDVPVTRNDASPKSPPPTSGKPATSSSNAFRLDRSTHKTSPPSWSTATRPSPGARPVKKAVEVAVATEAVAHLAMMSLQLEPALPRIEPELLNKHFKRKHGPAAY